jgi:hypothetical protein
MINGIKSDPVYLVKKGTFSSTVKLPCHSGTHIAIMLRILQLSLWILATVHASPYAEPTLVARDTNHLEKRVNCNAVNAALTVLKALGPPATTFCSSYLHIPATATATVTAPTPTV